MSKEIQQNQIDPVFLSVCAMNPFHQHTSSSRAYMMANHLGQMLVLNGSDERMIQSGVEREFAKYTFRVEMPCDAQIVQVIDRYNKGIGNDTIKENPETIVIYEDVNTKEIGMLRLNRFCSNHQYFGFKYNVKDTVNLLTPGNFIPKGTVFLDSPSVTDEGNYKYGVQANTVYMTHPSTSEDGIAIRRGFLKKLGFKIFETRTVEWGFNKYALNLYGDLNNYKPFPDIGEYIRPDGLLMALRSNVPVELAAVEKSISRTMEVDHTFDTSIYVNGGGGKVIDIKIQHDMSDNNYAEKHMDDQPQKYDLARREFCNKIVDLWKRLHKNRGESLQLTPELNRLIVECYAVHSEDYNNRSSDRKQRIIKTYRKAPIDNFRVEFVIEYDIDVGVGFKMTGLHGDKGVLCQIIEDDEMPVDQDGNRADIIMDPNSTINRMNLGRFYEQYYNSASRDVHKRICNSLNITPFTNKNDSLAVISGVDKKLVNDLYNYLLNYYKIISPTMYSWFTDNKISDSKEDYLAEIVNKGVGLFIPTNNEPLSEDIVLRLEESRKQIEENYKPLYGPISYIGNSGKRVTTKNNIRIGSVYYVLLEKTGDDWNSVSSGKLQHFGILSQITKQDKFSKPARNQAVRGSGEAEVRIMISYIGPQFVAELMDRNNNPFTHNLIIHQILSDPTPTDIDNLVDRNLYKYGGSKPLQLVRHILEVSGVKFKYVPHNPSMFY